MFQDPIAKQVQMNRLLERAETAGIVKVPVLRATTQVKNQRIKKSLLQKFKDATATDGKVPRKLSLSNISKDIRQEIQGKQFPTINSFTYMKKGDGMGKSFLTTKTSFGRCSKLEYMDSLTRTFMNS